MDNLKIKRIDPGNISEQFCRMEDHNGAFIVAKIGRDWLLTNVPGMVNDFCTEIYDSGIIHSICFNENKISDWKI